MIRSSGKPVLIFLYMKLCLSHKWQQQQQDTYYFSPIYNAYTKSIGSPLNRLVSLLLQDICHLFTLGKRPERIHRDRCRPYRLQTPNAPPEGKLCENKIETIVLQETPSAWKIPVSATEHPVSNTPDISQSCFQMLKIPDPESYGGGIKSIVRKGQRFRIALHHLGSLTSSPFE